MKIKEGYLLREVAGSHVAVPTGQAAVDFSGMITLNDSGAFLWKLLAEGAAAENGDEAEKILLAALLEKYDTDADTAQRDIAEFVKKLKAADLLA